MSESEALEVALQEQLEQQKEALSEVQQALLTQPGEPELEEVLCWDCLRGRSPSRLSITATSGAQATTSIRPADGKPAERGCPGGRECAFGVEAH